MNKCISCSHSKSICLTVDVLDHVGCDRQTNHYTSYNPLLTEIVRISQDRNELCNHKSKKRSQVTSLSEI